MSAILRQRLAAFGVALCLCIVVVFSTGWNLGIALVEPRLAGGFLDDPARTLGQLRADLNAGRFELSQEYRKQFLVAARRDPLSDEPFVLQALNSSEQGRYREALVRLEQARKRDPRNRLTRIMLFDAYLRSGMAKEVVIEAVALDRLRTGATPELLPLLASLAQNPSTRQAATQALGGSPLEYPILRALAEQQVSPELLMSFANQPMAKNTLDYDTKQQIYGLVAPYIDSGKWSEAAELWMHFYARRPAELARIIDTKFTGNLGPPFGWQLNRSDGGFAEQGDKGLQVVDFGRKRWEVVRHALLIRPGRYRLRYKLNGDTADSPDLAWRLDCAESGENLLDLPFQNKEFLGMVVTDRFTVPADNCAAQWLSLNSGGGAIRETRSALIRSIDISQLGEE